MAHIQISHGQSKIFFEEHHQNGMAPLSYYIDIAANAANIWKSGDVSGANKYISDRTFVGKSCYANSHLQMVAGLCQFLVGNFEQGFLRLKNSYDDSPVNTYAMYLLKKIYEFDIGNYEEKFRNILYWSDKKDFSSVGDSHSHCNFIGIPRCEVYWIGSVTMYRVGKRGFASFDFDWSNIKKNSNLILTFGEIDARVHIFKQSKMQNMTTDDLVEDVVIKYINEIKNFFIGSRSFRLILSSIVPPMKFPDYSRSIYSGNPDDRLKITMKMNEVLRFFCEKDGFQFFDPFESYMDCNGFLLPERSDGSHHVNPHQCREIEEKLVELAAFR